MTAEIAILNRIGVALAADSAVSIRTSGSLETKVYNSVDKLFSLSHDEPVGVMINGTAEVMGIPIETLIKTFRDSPYARAQETVSEYGERFFEFLRAEVPADVPTVLRQAAGMLVRRFLHIHQMAMEAFEARSPKSKAIKLADFVKNHFRAELRRGLTELRRRKPLAGCGPQTLPPGLKDVARHAIDQTLGSEFLDLADDAAELASLLMTRDIPMGNAVRFVFAGFGTSQIFPAVYAADWDGPLVGTHKVRQVSDQAISSEQSALILPFAQQEMVDRFMDGVDSAYVDFVESAMERAISRFVQTTLDRSGCKEQAPIKKEIEGLLGDFMEEFKKGAFEFRVETFRHSVLEVVQFMPKSDLAEMAESLVNLTSIKRRVSAERETVGGPIDVAVISRNDGFVWIKRKRYFERGINERFFLKQRLRLEKWVDEHGDGQVDE